MKVGLLINLSIILVSSVGYANEIEWHVDQPFRFIKPASNNSDFSIPKGESALKFIETRMALKDRRLLPPHDQTYWDANVDSDRRLPEDYIFPTKHKVLAKLTKSVDGDCLWKYQLQTQTEKCSEVFSFDAITQFGEGSPKLKVKILASEESLEADVAIKDRLILGLGDSYGSGEGNPDLPTLISESGSRSLERANPNGNTTGRWMVHKDIWVEQNAGWLDRQCHRSFFSQQIMASLKLAGRNPHETITIVPLACSGAEVLDGLLIPQNKPPGGGRAVKESQINFAVKHLCRGGALTMKPENFERGYTGKNRRKLKTQDMYRCNGELRKPDAIFLSVGGNDVGFAPVIAWATIPQGFRNPFGYFGVNITNKVIDPVCPKYNGQDICERNKPVGKDRVKNWLPAYYEYLSQQLSRSGLITDGEPDKVYFTAYPNPTYIEDGKTYCGSDRSTDMVEQARSKLPFILRPRVWGLGLTSSEMEDINVGLITPLYVEMKRSAQIYKWKFIDSYIPELLKNGICSGYIRHDKDIPIYPHVRSGVWYPEDLVTTWAYDVNRLHWFRNTNDSVLFQTDHTDSDMNGAFHPDFRVHAVIADHLADKVSSDWYPPN